MRFLFSCIFMINFFAGCSDYNLTKHREAAEPGVSAPEIEVTPVSHDFGSLNAVGEDSSIIVKIKNIGTDTLSIDDVYLVDGSQNFTLISFPSTYLEPSDSTEAIIHYDPETYESNSDIVSIWSNDEDEKEVQVPIGGSGDAPVIRITPESFDFGSLFIGCDDSLGILIENIGNANLEISDIKYFASLPVDFSIEDYELEDGVLPWTLAPGDWRHIKIGYMPLDALDDGAWVEIISNDPINPMATSEHVGEGEYEAWVTDDFKQDGEVSVDILFVVDNSGSMSANQTNLKNNFDSFIAVYDTAGVDYNIAIITTDSSSFIGDIITSATADPVTEFNDQIDLVGWRGSAHEKGLWYSYESTSGAGDAAPGSSTGFFREPAKLVVVYVSDEQDWSHQTYGSGGSATMTPSDYSAHLLSLKSSSHLVVAHGVAGDYPSGCSTNGHATFGDGYYDVVSDLGGTFMSICAEDWSVTMDTLARESLALLSFELTETPFEETISVTVEGYVSSDWSYDELTNSVVFATPPGDSSEIEVNYAILSDCESEDTGTSEEEVK